MRAGSPSMVRLSWPQLQVAWRVVMGWLRCLRAPRTLAQAGAACPHSQAQQLTRGEVGARSEGVAPARKSSDPVGMIGLDIGKNAGTHHAAQLLARARRIDSPADGKA